MAEERTVFNTKLDDTPHEYWANSILARLAHAIGLFGPGETAVQVDPDELLEEIEFRLGILQAVEAEELSAVVVEEEDVD